MVFVWLKDIFPQNFYVHDLESVNTLLQRMSKNSPVLTMDDVRGVAELGCMHVVMAHDLPGSGRIVGMARLVSVPMLVGIEGIIEDVVVEEAYEGRHIGTSLVTRLLEKGRELGLRRIELATQTDRAPANRLYASLGFERLGVSFYRKAL